MKVQEGESDLKGELTRTHLDSRETIHEAINWPSHCFSAKKKKERKEKVTFDPKEKKNSKPSTPRIGLAGVVLSQMFSSCGSQPFWWLHIRYLHYNS